MKYFVLSLCLVLAACGSRRDRVEPMRGTLDGVSHFLSNAFADRSGGGGLCGDPALVGEKVGFVEGRISACGIQDGVRLQSVSGVTLSQPALIDCNTARALRSWVETSAIPTLRRQGGGLAELKVAAHYSCRTRNNQPGAKISEHGRGKAIDISAFRLRDGSEVTVLNDWGGGKRGKALRRMHADACGPFGTVLGPRADRFHQDHFHFDTKAYRGGAYCQ